MGLDKDKLVAALKDPQRDLAVSAWAAEHNLQSSTQEILAIIAMVCKATEEICPLFGD